MKRNSSATNDYRTLWLREQVRGGLLASSLALSRLLEKEMDRALAIVPLTASGLVALLEIAHQPPATQRQLAARLGQSPGSVSETLGRLRACGLIRRRPAPPGAERSGAEGAAASAVGTEATAHGRRRGARGLSIELTGQGEVATELGVEVARRLEADWATRLAPTTGSPLGLMRRQGLIRWLTEFERALR